MALNATQQAFVDRYGAMASAVGDRLGVAPISILSQWALESRWGTSPLAVGSNNLAGITQRGIEGEWASYGSPADFGAAFTSLIERNYGGAMGTGSDVQAYASGLAAGRIGSYYGTESPSSYGAKLAALAAQIGPVTGSLPGDVGVYDTFQAIPSKAPVANPGPGIGGMIGGAVADKVMSWGTNVAFVIFGMAVVAVVVAGGVGGKSS